MKAPEDNDGGACPNRSWPDKFVFVRFHRRHAIQIGMTYLSRFILMARLGEQQPDRLLDRSERLSDVHSAC